MNTQRHFFLGDNWLYFKLYTGFKTADLLLKKAIFPLTQQLKQNQIVSHWFFIRYNDPDFHLRVRFYLPDIHKIGDTIQQIYNALQSYFQTGLLWKVQYDTYNREIERYGIDTIDLSEKIFCTDSEMIVKLLNGLHGNESEKQRWLLSLRAIDELLTTFNYSIEKKLALLYSLQENFGKEFHIDGNFKKQFSLNFRENRKEIEKIIKANKEDESLLLPIFQKSEQIKKYVERILEYEQNKKLQISLDNLLCGYIHMMLNRFFRTQQRKHELVLYDYLYRYYDSEINRLKYQQKNSNETLPSFPPT
jgi:thiopeptide-type bacteriocin biosynthesis protein